MMYEANLMVELEMMVEVDMVEMVVVEMMEVEEVEMMEVEEVVVLTAVTVAQDLSEMPGRTESRRGRVHHRSAAALAEK